MDKLPGLYSSERDTTIEHTSVSNHCGGPAIAPVPAGTPRPFWSVMLPVYNPSSDLEMALKSVLAQAPGPEEMEIEVIDDDSPSTCVEEIVRDVGKGRVRFYRNAKNLGLVRNFNACLERAHGHWVHILHQDDMVVTGFYRTMEQLARANPAASMLCCRSVILYQDGNAEVTPLLRGLEQFTSDPRDLLYRNHLRFGVVLRRDFCEREGGFKPFLPFMSDWEMWVRAIRWGGAVMARAPLHYYRFHPGSMTTVALRDGTHASEQLLLAEEIRKAVPEVSLRRHRSSASWGAFLVMCRHLRTGDQEAALANEKVWKRIAPAWLRIFFRFLQFALG